METLSLSIKRVAKSSLASMRQALIQSLGCVKAYLKRLKVPRLRGLLRVSGQPARHSSWLSSTKLRGVDISDPGTGIRPEARRECVFLGFESSRGIPDEKKD